MSHVVAAISWLAVGITSYGMGAQQMVPILTGQELTEEEWDALAQCESSGRWYVNTGNGYYGGLQISLDTWTLFGGKRLASRPDLASRELQIEIAQRILEGQGLDAWPVCSYRVGLQ